MNDFTHVTALCCRIIVVNSAYHKLRVLHRLQCRSAAKLTIRRFITRHSSGASLVASSRYPPFVYLLMASTALEIAATSPTPFRTGASEVQFACCARFSGHRFRPTALGTWASLFFMERRAIHRIFHDRSIFTRRLGLLQTSVVLRGNSGEDLARR